METIKLQEVKDRYALEKQAIELKEGVIVTINAKLQEINGTQTEIQKWDKSIGDIKNHIDKATMLQGKLEAESRIEQLNEEIEKLWKSIGDNEPIEKSSVVSYDIDKQIDEKSIHRKWLNTNLLKYLGFAVVSLLLFIFIHGSQFIISKEWSELLNSFRYTHQIFLKISMGFFGILSMGASIKLIMPSVLYYLNSKVHNYDFLKDFVESDARTRLLVSCFILYCLMEYWGKIMAWEIVL